MTHPAVEIVNVVKKYNGRRAVLDGMTYLVENREFVTVYGKSGCGKTTLLNIIGGLDRPSSGGMSRLTARASWA